MKITNEVLEAYLNCMTKERLTDDIFAAYLKCRYKAHLKLAEAAGEKSDYERSQDAALSAYRTLVAQELRRKHAGSDVLGDPLSLPDALRGDAALVLNAVAQDPGGSCRLDALERDSVGPAATYRPVLFVPGNKVSADDRLRLGFAASVLARVQGRESATGKIVHGKELKSSRVELPTLSAAVAEAVADLGVLAAADEPPPLVLNRHCAECEFRHRCRAEAVRTDDLSLLLGLSAKERAALHARGIFTVTQLSYTFRPGRLKRAGTTPPRKHDHALQALALRENTIYVARRPELPAAKTTLFLDVEGLPDEDFYYLIGLTVADDAGSRHLAFWADTPADEGTMWAAFLAAVARLDDFVLFHYGKYESEFLDRMQARHGGDAGLVARLRERGVNVLSQVYARVYFPALGNDLKNVAGCLGFRWSAAEASGLQSIAWRRGWETTRDDALKQSLLTYNREDCSALGRVVETLVSLASTQTGQTDGRPRVAEAAEAGGQYHCKFGCPPAALPGFADLSRRAYFDYQRDKVTCRTSPRKKAAAAGKERRRRRWKVNREVEWGRPECCPLCGSAGFDQQASKQKLVIDLKPFRGGIKRQVTCHKAKRYRCRDCQGTFLPPDYLALSCGYGWGVVAWVVYASIASRQSNKAIDDTLGDLFEVRFGRSYASKVRQRAIDRYRPMVDGLLASLRAGPVVHADETKVTLKGGGRGYVWVFASPDTAVYLYSPTREGGTARETLAGFRGVLVSDFYAAYDALDCPQQKCLIHLIRDLNDDLLKHPFDEELKGQAARFTTLLQAAVATIDRFGLKRYHLAKHKKEAERFLAAEADATYRSELAGHYQQRLEKYRDKLFTFLDHDGVPWHNNNAENAVKQFVSRRKVVGPTMSEEGMRDYLVLLSLYQTLRYRGVNFWRFLLSGETDIEAFAAKRRR